MKRQILLGTLLLAAIGCGSQPTSTNNDKAPPTPAVSDAKQLDSVVFPEKPANAVSVRDVLTKKDGEKVVMTGKTLPANAKPYNSAVAAFMLMAPEDMERDEVKEEFSEEDPRACPACQKLLAQYGVEVEIVIPAISDQHLMDWAMRGYLRFFRYIRARIIATPPPFDHTKLCTVDGEWSLIGSSNWDARSFRLNFEFDLEIIDPAFTAQLDALIDARIARGKVLTPDMLAAEPVWKRLRNAAARLLMPYL